MNSYFEWAKKWDINPAAMLELRSMLLEEAHVTTVKVDTSEAAVQAQIRMEAAEKGMVLWRNNVGASKDDNGNWFRFGLANDSIQMSRRIKSSDLIGIRPVLITPDHVGTTMGQFVAREVKKASWVFTGTDREIAQEKFLTLVTTMGGDAKFTNSIGSL
jgi:hypothetical protein